MIYTDIDYGNDTAEVVRDDGWPHSPWVVVRLEGEHAATEAYVVAGALNDAYKRGKNDAQAANNTIGGTNA